jgi:hypothetical protein
MWVPTVDYGRRRGILCVIQLDRVSDEDSHPGTPGQFTFRDAAQPGNPARGEVLARVLTPLWLRREAGLR